MRTACKREAVLKEKFWFENNKGELREARIDEIINGSENFSGVAELAREWINDRL